MLNGAEKCLLSTYQCYSEDTTMGLGHCLTHLFKHIWTAWNQSLQRLHWECGSLRLFGCLIRCHLNTQCYLPLYVYSFSNHWLSQSLCPCAFFSWLLPSFAYLFSSASFPECNLSQPFFFIQPQFLHLALWSNLFSISTSCTSVSICSWDVTIKTFFKDFLVLGFTVVSSWTASGSSHPFSWWFCLNSHPLCLFLPNPHFFPPLLFTQWHFPSLLPAHFHLYHHSSHFYNSKHPEIVFLLPLHFWSVQLSCVDSYDRCTLFSSFG